MTQSHSNDAGRLADDLAREHGADLVRFIARRLRSEADARDLAREAYVRLLSMKRQDLMSDPRPYLYRIAANILYEFELKRKADVVGPTRWSQDEQAEVEPGDMDSSHLRGWLDSVLQGLSPKCRTVLILHRRERMTYEEISARTGISTSMVKKYLAQALQHCREHLKELR
ncbi:MAG TPA: sigma-70 family RNA polymerase sigma factor [Steroidobacteraceae bacterium]